MTSEWRRRQSEHPPRQVYRAVESSDNSWRKYEIPEKDVLVFELGDVLESTYFDTRTGLIRGYNRNAVGRRIGFCGLFHPAQVEKITDDSADRPLGTGDSYRSTRGRSSYDRDRDSHASLGRYATHRGRDDMELDRPYASPDRLATSRGRDDVELDRSLQSERASLLKKRKSLDGESSASITFDNDGVGRLRSLRGGSSLDNDKHGRYDGPAAASGASEADDMGRGLSSKRPKTLATSTGSTGTSSKALSASRWEPPSLEKANSEPAIMSSASRRREEISCNYYASRTEAGANSKKAAVAPISQGTTAGAKTSTTADTYVSSLEMKNNATVEPAAEAPATAPATAPAGAGAGAEAKLNAESTDLTSAPSHCQSTEGAKEDLTAGNTEAEYFPAPEAWAAKARFPPGCNVLHPDAGVAGKIRSVHLQLLSPQLSGEVTLSIRYKIEMREDSGGVSLIPEEELQFAPDCPVQVLSEVHAQAANEEKWDDAKVQKSFQEGEEAEKYIVIVDGTNKKIFGVSRQHIRFRPPTQSKETAALASAADSSASSQKVQMSSSSTHSIVTASDEASKSSDQQGRNVVERLDVPAEIDFAYVKETLVGPGTKAQGMMTRLKVKIHVVGKDLEPPQDVDSRRDFGHLLPVRGINGYPLCILIKGREKGVETAAYAIAHLLIGNNESISSSDKKRELKNQLLGSISKDEDCSKPSPSAVRSSSPKVAPHNVATTPSRTRNSEKSRMSPVKADSGTLARRQTPTHSHSVDSDTTVQYCLPNWIQWRHIKSSFNSDEKINIEQNYSCKIIIVKISENPIKCKISKSGNRSAWPTWCGLIDCIAHSLPEDMRPRFLYEAICDNYPGTKESGRWPVMVCTSPFDESQKVQMAVMEIPDRGNYSGYVIGTRGSTRKEIEGLGCDFELYECDDESVGSFFLVSGDDHNAVKEARNIVQERIDRYREIYTKENESESDSEPDVDVVFREEGKREVNLTDLRSLTSRSWSQVKDWQDKYRRNGVTINVNISKKIASVSGPEHFLDKVVREINEQQLREADGDVISQSRRSSDSDVVFGGLSNPLSSSR